MNEVTYKLKKACERCQTPLPDSYGNLLCDIHYWEFVQEQDLVKHEKEQELKKSPDSAINPDNVATREPIQEVQVGATNASTYAGITPNDRTIIPSDKTPADFGILDPNYKENPEQDDKEQILANLAQFIYTHDLTKGKKGKLLWYPQRNMYNFIKNYCLKKIMEHPQYPKYIWKPKIVDVGCGSGVGSNILSLEADMVWGIDKNEFSIEFAKEAFTREKNGIYYSSQLTFDIFDILNDSRQCMQFEVVVAIEVIEHIYDTDKFLRALIEKFSKKDKRGNYVLEGATEFFISSPNRNSPKIRKDHPENIFHVREWSSQELKSYLERYFNNVTLMNQKGEPVPDDTIEQVILLKCSYPKV